MGIYYGGILSLCQMINLKLVRKNSSLIRHQKHCPFQMGLGFSILTLPVVVALDLYFISLTRVLIKKKYINKKIKPERLRYDLKKKKTTTTTTFIHKPNRWKCLRINVSMSSCVPTPPLIQNYYD